METLAPYDVLCHLRERTAMPATVIHGLPNLKFMTVTGKAHRTLDLAAATSQGVLVSHVSSGDPPSFGAPELAWGLVLAVTKRLVEHHDAVRGGGWQTGLGMELHGKTLGLLGLGALGQQMSRYAHAFGMKVIAWSPNLSNELAEEHSVQRVDKSSFFQRSDVISIHVVLSDRSRSLVGFEEFGQMKHSAVIVNTSRGPIVQESALLHALAAGQIAGAGLDVFDIEPLPVDHPLRQMPNVVLSPHVGYATQDTFRRFYEATVRGLCAYLDGAPIHLLNPDASAHSSGTSA